MSNNDIKPSFIKCTDSNIIDEIIKDIHKYDVIIDNGSYFKEKSLIEYVKQFLEKVQ